MKKLIAMLLCFAMVAAFGASAAFAEIKMPNQKIAENYIRIVRNDLNALKRAESSDKAIEKAVKAMEAYEAVKYDSSKTKEQVDKAYEKVCAVFKELNIPLDRFDPNTVTSTSISKLNIFHDNGDPGNLPIREYDGYKWSEIYSLLADKYTIYANYWLSSGTKMDINERDIGLAAIDAAAKLEHAQADAAAAKAGAVKAQATAKSLIADTIKTAQDAAATAIANAQASAYKQLADNYADAVEAFWSEVENTWF